MQPRVQAYTVVCMDMAVMRDLRPDVLVCSSFHYDTPFYTPTEFSEEEIANYLQAGYNMIKEARYKILVAHCPPYQTAIDRLHAGSHVGSYSVRTFIETYQPDLCISGHIHEAPGEDTIGQTLLLNPGMLAQGGYVTVTCTPETLIAQRVPGHDTRHYSSSPFMPSSL